jgi:MFS transporter, DHA2 family, multidrug resistance protein
MTASMMASANRERRTVTTEPRAGRREWIGLAVIALPCLLYSMDLTVLNLAVPHLTADLRPSSTQLLWIVDIYGFLVAGSLITMGTLGDRIGRRKLLMIGAATFGVASVLAAMSRSAAMLVVARGLLGVAGATLAPSTLSLIRNMFQDSAQRTLAIGIWGMSYAVGGAIGPLLGGMMLEHFWWGSVFLLAVPVMVLLLVLGPVLLPEYRDPNAGRLDVLSAALSLVAVLATIYGLKVIAATGASVRPLLAIAAGIAVGTAFVRRQLRLADPLIDLRLFRTPAFSAALAVNMLGGFMIFGSFLYTAQYFQLVLGLSPLDAGLWMLPGSVTVTLGSLLSPIVVRRTRPAVVIAAGLVCVAAGFALFMRLGGDDLSTLILANIVLSLGLGPIFILTTDIVVSSAPPERAGAASATSETGSELGGALGIGVLGSIGTAIYRTAVVERLANASPATRDAARETLGSAVAAAERMPGEAGAAVRSAAQGAFIDAFHAISIVNIAIALALAVVVAVVLRNKRAPADALPDAEPATAA